MAPSVLGVKATLNTTANKPLQPGPCSVLQKLLFLLPSVATMTPAGNTGETSLPSGAE